MLTIDEMANAIRATRDDFNNVFMQAQVGFPVGDRVQFEAIGNSANNVDAFKAALTYADLKGWLKLLVDSIVANGLEDGHIAADISNPTPGSDLQAMINNFAGFMQPHIVVKGLDKATRWTGKILIDRAPQGTGILIASNRLLTAWHVVKSLFTKVGTAPYEPDPAAGTKLEIVFDDFLEIIGRGNGLLGRGTRRVKAHADWCVHFSVCHQDELASMLPQNLNALNGFWDYAIIRLAEPIGFERGWAMLDDRAVVPKAQEKILILQHPAGQAMRLDFDDIAGVTETQRTAIPRLRFLHYLNTLPGSSGGPCFDKSLTFFGFHQGEWNGLTRPTNRGVPIVRVIEDVKGKLKDEPEESLVWELADHSPVIGSEDFQQAVLKSLQGEQKVFTILGNKGTGKTFHSRVLSAMLPDATHLKVELSAGAIATKGAGELANMICSKAGAGTLVFEPISDVFSTPAVWLKDELVRKLIDAIDRIRNGRTVWLFLTDLNTFEIDGENASAFLFLLYEQILSLAWLRVVLDGMKGDLPASLRALEYRHRCQELTKLQIATYLQRLATFFNLDIDQVVQAESQRLFQRYDKKLGSNSEVAALTLANEIVEEIIPLFASFSN
jgi:trypsin-like peptidase